MILENLIAPKTVIQCKVCNHAAALYGVVDFNKSCEENRGMFLPLTGIPVYYHQCSQCGLVFTEALDNWDKDLYKKHIYNEDYIKVDPDYKEVRPQNFSKMVGDFIAKGSNLKLLDYGGGNGEMSRLMREKNIDSHSWDPMEITDYVPPKGSFDLVTAFEVFEHTPTPLQTAEEALSYLKPDGVLLFSTVAINSLPPHAVHFWYISPRNGHITIHTKKSLAILFARFGYHIHHFSEGSHLAYKAIPKWLS